MTNRGLSCALGLSAAWMGAIACGGPETASNSDALIAICVADPSLVPSGAWMCGDERVVECATPNGTRGPTLYLVDASCGELTLSDRGPFLPGTRDIEVTDSTVVLGQPPSDRLLCTATLTVVDRTPPTITDRGVTMWPPNHKLHHFSVADCAAVTDVCDPSLDLQFTYVASDEPINANGDGNTAPDVVLGCDGVDLRSERQGGSDGRVYTLGVRAVDAAGNVTEGACTVSVAHDQGGRGAAVSSNAAYRVDAPATCSGNP